MKVTEIDGKRVALIDLYSQKYPGLYALVDIAHYQLVKNYNWYVYKGVRSQTFYATGYCYPDPTMILMHRLITGFKYPEVDHKDRNGLNNQSDNLRDVTHKQNCVNVLKQPDETTSQYQGVSWQKDFNCWRAYIKTNGRFKQIGTFLVETDAALAYNDAALEMHGEFAALNVVPVGKSEQYFDIPSGYRGKRKSTKPKSSKYKGVCWAKRPNGWQGKWMARIRVEGKNRHLGTFDSERDAAIVYNNAAIELFGKDSVWLNDVS